MKRACGMVLICLALLACAQSWANGDPKLDEIYGMDRNDYQGLFAMTGKTDGAYADALAGVLAGSFFCSPADFLNTLGKVDAETQDAVIGLIAYDVHQKYPCATHPFLVLEDELSLAEGQPGVDAALVERFREGIADYWASNGPEATY